MQQSPIKFNKVWIGVVLGIVTPVATIFIVYLIKFNGVGVDMFYKSMDLMNAFTKLLSLCVLPNLGLFYIFLRTNRLLSARGILFATIIDTIVVLLLKLL